MKNVISNAKKIGQKIHKGVGTVIISINKWGEVLFKWLKTLSPKILLSAKALTVNFKKRTKPSVRKKPKTKRTSSFPSGKVYRIVVGVANAASLYALATQFYFRDIITRFDWWVPLAIFIPITIYLIIRELGMKYGRLRNVTSFCFMLVGLFCLYFLVF